MNRFIVFTNQTQEIIDEVFHLASKIWGDDIDFSNVRILAGNYSDYGSNYAQYNSQSKLIQISLLNKFSHLKLNEDGIEIKKDKLFQFKGLLLHELGHHVEHYHPEKPWLTIKAGYTTHSKSSWCWVATQGQNYFDNNLNITTELVTYGVKQNIENIKKELSQFDPYSPPIKLLEKIKSIQFKNKNAICKNCNNHFSRKRTDKIFCSPKCKMSYSRKRNK